MNRTDPSAARRPLLEVLRSSGSRHLFVLSLLGAVCQHGGAVVAAAAGGWVVGAAVEGRNASALMPGGIALAAGFVAATAGYWLNLHASHAFGWRHQAKLRLAVYDGVAASAPRPILEMSTGEIASVVMADVESLEQFFAHLAPTGVAAAVVALGTAVALATVSLAFTAVFVVGAVAVAIIPSRLARRAARRGEELRRGLGLLNTTVIDGIKGLRELVLLRRVDDWNDRIGARTRDYAVLQARQARADGVLRAATDLTVSATVVVTLLLAVSRAADERITLAAAAAAIIAVIGALRPIVEATGMAAALAPLRASARRVLLLVGQTDPVADAAPNTVELADTRVTFDQVRFGYEPDQIVLDATSFTAEPGEMVALVGASGAGKSTCANLLLRFWDVDGGRITVGGHDLRDLPVAQLRRLVAIVPQQVDLFTGTVADNLRVGAPDATGADLEAAARSAQAHDFITSLPDGYQTQVGEDGARLSGGQRQRLAIARALLHQAPILILDEAASNLDTENERAIHEALRAARGDHTVLVIAHRLSTIRMADRIVVLEDGRVVEQGHHHDLLERGDRYTRLMAHQT